MGALRLPSTIFVACSCIIISNFLATDLLVRYTLGMETNLQAAIIVMIACADGIIGVPFMAAYSVHTHPVVAYALASSSSMCVPAFFAAVFCACGVQQPALLAALSLVGLCVWAAIAPLHSFVLSRTPGIRETEAAEPDEEDLYLAYSDEPGALPYVVGTECYFCHEPRAMRATLFTCGHAFVCADCFPRAMHINPTVCPLCESPRIYV